MSDLTARLRADAKNIDATDGAQIIMSELEEEAAARIEALEAERAALIEAALDHRATASRALGRERDAHAVIAEALAIHVPMAYWSGDSHDAMYDADGEEVEPEGHVCLTCSGPSVEDDISNWELDLSDSAVVLWPCETVQALSRVSQGAAEPMPILLGSPEAEALVHAEPWTDPKPWKSRFNGDRSPVDLSHYNPGLWTYLPRSREQYDAEEGNRG